MKRLDSLPTKLQHSRESTSLLPKDGKSLFSHRYLSTRKCVTSKAALLILVWCVTVSLAFHMVDHLHNFYNLPQTFGHVSFLIVSYAISIFLDYFYPLAGFLADVKLSRYKVVFGSVCFILVAILLLLPGGGVFATIFDFAAGRISSQLGALLIILGCVIVLPGVVFLFTGFVGFKANIIQFGLDQLYDYPGDDQVVFLHWQVWSFYVAKTVHSILANYWIHYHDNIGRTSYIFIGAVFILIAAILATTLYVAHRKREWFLLQPSKFNPYRLVCRATKFAWKHKVPIRRSAFTYCEDEVPTRLDLGKRKYGGPFTTEQVEDVKAFYGVLKVLSAFGSIFILNIATNPVASLFYKHLSNSSVSNDSALSNSSNLHRNPIQIAEVILLEDGLLSPLLVVICIPFYLFALRPLFHYHTPGPLKRMGLGYFISVIGVLFLFVLETVAHAENHSYMCLFEEGKVEQMDTANSTQPNMSYLRYVLVVEHFLSALSHMLGYVALNEFICSQSPRSMTGLLIGLSFAVRGVFELGASALVIPLSLHVKLSFPSCGMVFYAAIVVVGVTGLTVFVSVARTYKYRQRDEPCHVQRYVEEYYDNLLS